MKSVFDEVHKIYKRRIFRTLKNKQQNKAEHKLQSPVSQNVPDTVLSLSKLMPSFNELRGRCGCHFFIAQ